MLPPPTPPATRHDGNTLPATRHRDNASLAAGKTTGETTEVDEYVGAHVRGLAELVPPYMADSIKRYEKNGTLKAGVRMLFPGSDLGLPCTITFDILDQSLQFLASKLFNAHLERKGMSWVLYYDNDARKVGTGPGCTLQSCTTEVIPSLFGQLITSGNVASPHRQEEACAGKRYITESVRMELREAGKGAFITLSMGSIEGSQVFEKLYA